MQRTEPDALVVGFSLPAGCTRVAFLKDGPGAGTIRSRWQPLNGGIAGSDALTHTASTPVELRFRVPVTSDKVTGYPGSFPVGEAVYAHMSNYAVGAQCGPVRYRFASTGAVETARASFDRRAPTDDDAPALLFLKPRSAAQGLDYLDPALSPEAAAQIRRVADETAAFLHQRMPHAIFKRPIIAATLASEPGGPNIGGSAGEILLLSLFNWPAAPDPEVQRKMNKLVAHEMSHRFQMRDAVEGYRDARLIHEGGAEFLRWAVSLERGWLTPEQAGAELDDALATCMLATRERSWRAVPANEVAANWLEYSCGLPAYVYALAARQGEGSPFGRIDAFYNQLRAGAAPDFASAIECGDKPCQPRVLTSLLSGTAPMPDAWANILDSGRLAMRRPPTQAQIDAMMLQAITTLVKDDCNGDSSMTPTARNILIDGMKACKTTRVDIDVEQIEGKPVFGNGDALPAMVAACGVRKKVMLGLKGGGVLALPCSTPYRASTHFYAADMKKIIRKLLG
ncbi:hypothetical protein [Sphingomonas sp. S2-65]|uniref:hypothetical protein n=1 Tax=Sphingomonas sp. S2-65 TaxID=2903960 RepID=UPI001F45FFA0|nr:hypothetical protein [Sphingomonas sp. S2-65]UYY58669.1 hypothetical protein LZ586_00685 [Sphingomonas sp. S2-65]